MRREKAPPEEADDGAPEWMVTFSDCMTLLLTFFVLLLSFSTFDDDTIRNFKVIFAKKMVYVEKKKGGKNAVVSRKTVLQLEDYAQGSEKPTLEKGRNSGNKSEGSSTAHKEHKVFFRSSDEIFWGNGKIISTEGKRVLSNIAALLHEMPNRIAISERGNQQQGLGLDRAWAIVDYFTTIHDLDKKRFSISAGSLTDQEPQEQNQERILEVVLLERRIYN